MNNYIKKITLVLAIIGAISITSCKDDSSPEAPTLTLESELVQLKAGESVSVVVSYTTPEGFDRLVIDKKIDGATVNTQTVTQDGSGSYTFEYLVLVDDSDGILSFTFTVFDKDEMSASKDLIVEVELTKEQLLTKYDWLLSEEIRKKTGENDITDAYTDDIYRFNENGSYEKSIGDKADSFNDLWYNYCFWNLDDQDVLIMTKTGAFGEDVRDTLYVTSITSDKLEADVVYYGLDIFNTGSEDVPYEAREEYTKVFASRPKGENFDPYGPGSDNDGGPAGMCNDVTFE